MNIFDVNKAYNTPAERLLAAQSMLRRTTYGQGNVVRAELDGDVVVFVNNANPGVRHATIERAFAEAGQLELTQVSSVIRQGRQVTASTIGRRKQAGNRVGAAAGFVGDIFDKLRSLDQRNLQALADAGIDVADLLANGNVDILTMHAPSGGSKNIATRISEMRTNGQAHGITLIDDEGARILQFRSGQRMLNSYQANLLLSVTGHGLINAKALEEIMQRGDSDGLSSLLMKLGKRARSLLSERELSISGGELSRFIGKHASSLEEALLITDPQYEILRKYAGLDTGSALLDIYYADLDPQRYVKEVIEKANKQAAMNKLPSVDEDELKRAIKDFVYTGEKKWASDELEDFFENRFGKDSQMFDVAKSIFKRIEASFDASDLLNVDFFKKYIGGLNSEIKNIKSSLPNLSGNALIEARRRISELEGTVSQLSKAIEYGEQITGRGNVAGRGNIKAALNVAQLADAFKGKAGIISKFGLKGELGLAGDVDSFLMSGFGVARDAVFTDPVSVAFHPEVFADRETIEAISARSASILDEFKDSINNNVLPQKLRKMLEQSANLNPMDLKPELRASALRNRQFAQAILDMHAAGLSPRQAPQMMNMLSSIFAAQAYRDKKGFLQAVLPDTYRFALDSESITHGTNRRALLGTGYEKVSMQSSTGQSVSNDLVKFRVTGHKMMFAEGVIQDIREALGGFDLDDKGIPKLTTFTDENGRSRIAFHVTRQPSGVEERMLARASMDVETLRALFGQNEKFMKQLESMMPGTGQTAEELLHAVLTSSNTRQDQTVDEYVAFLNRRMQGGQIALPSGFTSFEDLMEETVRKVYEGMERRGITKLSTLTDEMVSVFGEFGSSRLAEKALSGEKQFTREGIFKIFEKAGAFDMRDDFRALLEDPSVIIGDNTRSFMTGLLDDPSKSFDDILKAMVQRIDDPAIETLMNLAFQEKSINMAKEGGDILGVYVNRSMVIGSTLNQYQDFLNNLLQSNPGTNQRRAMEYMKRNMQIGLLSQETAIDLSVNFSGTKRILLDISDAALASSNKAGAEAAVQIGLQKLGGAGAGITLDQIGQNIIEETGRRIGFARSLEEGEAIGMGIDRMLIEQKLSNMDQRKLLQGIIAGTQEAIDQGFATSAGAADFISSANEVITKGENIQEFLLSNFGISASSRYASLSALDQSTTAAQFEAVKKGAMRRIVRDQALASVQVSSQSEAVARAIAERYSDTIEQMYSTVYGNYDQMSELQIYSNQGRLQKLGESILDDIEAGSKIEGVTLQDLVNAVDQQFEGKRFNLRELKFITDGVQVTKYEEMFQNIMDIRTLRNAEYFSKMDQLAGGMASNVRTRIEDELGESLNLASVEQKARQLLERQQPLDEDVADVLRYMLGETDLIGEGLDETAAGIARAEAERVANVINFMLRGEEVGQRNPSLQTVMQQIGDINSASQINENDTILRNMFDMYNEEIAEDGEVQKASYKRIGDYIRDKDYQQLLDDKLIRRGAMGMGALILGSLAYSTYKDRTHQDVQGPPLLPGGSAYEGMPARVPQIPGYANSGYNQGNNYRVSINGSQEDIENFNAAAAGLSNATMNTTIYNRIPDLSGNAITSLMDFLG